MSDNDKLAAIQALVSYGANKEAVKALKAFRKEIKGRAVPQRRKVMDCKKSVVIWFIAWALMAVNFGFSLYFNSDKADQIKRLEGEKTELIKDKSALQTQLAVKNGKLITAQKDLEEAHELMGALFLEAMSVTDSYNKLKQQKCKVKR